MNGENEIPLYTFLKSKCPSVLEEFRPPHKLDYKPLKSDDIRWNFEKFLLDHRGRPVRRYLDALDPMEIAKDIDMLLRRRKG